MSEVEKVLLKEIMTRFNAKYLIDKNLSSEIKDENNNKSKNWSFI